MNIDMDPIAMQASPAITSHYLRNHQKIPTKSWLLQSRKFYPSPITGLSSCTHDKAVAPHLFQTQICTSSNGNTGVAVRLIRFPYSHVYTSCLVVWQVRKLKLHWKRRVKGCLF